MSFNELKQHGTEDFPFELYKLNGEHPRYKMAMHWHASIELIHVLSGSLRVSLDERTFDCEAGDVVFVNSEVIHGAIPFACEYRCLVFQPAFLRTGNHTCNLFLDALLSQENFVLEKVTDDDARTLILSMMNTMDEKKAGYAFQTIGLAMQLFGVIQEKGLFKRALKHGKDTQKIYTLKRVLKYIRDNFALEITLDDMAREAGLSTKYFCSFFKSMTGTTPVKYLLTYRIERAARKLIGSDESITRIAYDCGFNNLSYFIKTFKELKKITPTAYRKR